MKQTNKPTAHIMKGFINSVLEQMKEDGEDAGCISDGYHTFDELYFHRMILFFDNT